MITTEQDFRATKTFAAPPDAVFSALNRAAAFERLPSPLSPSNP